MCGPIKSNTFNNLKQCHTAQSQGTNLDDVSSLKPGFKKLVQTLLGLLRSLGKYIIKTYHMSEHNSYMGIITYLYNVRILQFTTYLQAILAI